MVPQTPPGKPPNSEADSDEFLNRAFDDEDFADENMGGQGDEELHLLGHVASSRTPDVAEIYSPPRVTKHAPRLGLLPGFALDLTEVGPTDGKPWDFCDPIKRERERERNSVCSAKSPSF